MKTVSQLMLDLAQYQGLGWDILNDTYSVSLTKDSYIIDININVLGDNYELILYWKTGINQLNRVCLFSMTISSDQWETVKQETFDVLLKLAELHQKIQ